MFDLDSGDSKTVTCAVRVHHSLPGHNERDAEELWSAAAHVIRSSLNCIPAATTRVVAVGVTGHGNGAYFVDHAGRPTRYAIQASDTRAASLTSRWSAAGVPEALRPRVWNDLWPGQPGPLLRWLSTYEPDALAQSAALLMCGDYLRARLTGTLCAELTAWSCNGLLDSTAAIVSDEALTAYSIQFARRLIPPIVFPDAVVGTISADAAAVTDLPAGIPVVAGAVDNVAMQLGAGVIDDSRILVGAGTWSINQLLVPKITMTMNGPLGSVRPYAACLAIPDEFALLIEASATSASTLAWAMQRVARGVTAAADEAHANIYSYAIEHAARRRRRLDSPTFLPFLDGSRDVPQARGAWFGLSSASDDVDLINAVIEGVCLEHRRHVERLSRAIIGDPATLRLVGGAARSSIWAQLFADTTGRTVEVSPVEEIGTVGAALIAGQAIGLFSTTAAGLAHLNPSHHTFEADPSAVEFFESRNERYLRWVRIIEEMPRFEREE
ncbi:MAG: FGGY family carbohydrate kinase [Micrococcales bacterium]|nr:FGGY family carbohydrate kinase [Micrococcales bacterium]